MQVVGIGQHDLERQQLVASLDVAEVDIHDLGPSERKTASAFFHRLLQLGRQIVEEPAALDADAQARDRMVDLAQHIGYRAVFRDRVFGIMAGDHAEDARHVGHLPGHGTDGIEPGGHRHRSAA